MTSNQLLDDLNERIWPKLQASLQEVAVAVRGAIPTVHSDIAKVRTKFAALHAYASFATARDLSIADEDVVISISCAGGSAADSPMECKSDILVQGPAGYLLDGPRAE